MVHWSSDRFEYVGTNLRAGSNLIVAGELSIFEKTMYVQATAINFLSVPTKISPGDSNPGSPEKKPRRWASGNADEGKKSREQEEEDEFRALHEKRKFSS